MAIKILTDFEITELPDPNVITSEINGIPIIVNTKYPIAQENLLTWERTASFVSKPVKTFFKYRVHSGSVIPVSNEAIVGLLWTGVSANPTSSNLLQVILNSITKNLLTELPLNDVTEFIEIISMTGVQNLKFNSNPVYIGQRLTLIDLYYTSFTSEATGGGNPYFILTYKVGRGSSLESINYTLTFNIVSLSILSILSGPTVINYTEDIDTGGGVIVNYNVIEQSAIFEISLGYAFSVANATIVIASPFLALNSYNSIFVDFNGNQTEELVDTTINAAINLDKYGKAQIKINNVIVVDTADPKLGLVTITLIDIDGDPALVNGPQVQTLTTNL